MTDLIDRQAILKHIEKIRQGVQMMDDIHRASIIMNGMHLCEEAVRNQPYAEQERRGQWVIRDNPGTGWYRVTCSKCGEDVTNEIPLIGFFPTCKAIWDYCPYCGAKMDGERRTDETD